MSLPIRTTVDDIVALCNYLAGKPIGATPTEAKAVLDPGVLDGRKINAMKFWGFIEDTAGKMILTERGRGLAKDKAARKAHYLAEVIKVTLPYHAIIERVHHRNEDKITSPEVAAHWHKNFKANVSDAEKILNDQAVCFFHIAQGADLGELVVGRHGQPTRFEFHAANVVSFLNGASGPAANKEADEITPLINSNAKGEVVELHHPAATPSVINANNNNRVFITHGKNKKILDQVKEIVTYGGFEPILAVERESGAKPVPEKVMADMRTCAAAVIHVAVDTVLFDKERSEHPQINGNVLIEIGAAMALYPGYKFILLVEEGLKLPSNLQGLYECRYTGSELTGAATMKLLKAFNEFKAAA